MYDVLQGISDHAKLQIVLNAVEKGSNPWGCTDYLNQKKKILETGADVYEPVSYTHLDVYKRQPFITSGLAPIRGIKHQLTLINDQEQGTPFYFFALKMFLGELD